MAFITAGVSISTLIAKAKSGLSITATLKKMSLGNIQDFKRMLRIAKSLNIQGIIDDIVDDDIDIETNDVLEPKYNLHWFTASAWIESAKYIPDDKNPLMIVTFRGKHGPLTFNNHPFEKYQEFITAPSAGSYYKSNLELTTGSEFVGGFTNDIEWLIPSEMKKVVNKGKQVINAAKNPLKFAKGQGLSKMNRVKGASQVRRINTKTKTSMKKIKKIGGKS